MGGVKATRPLRERNESDFYESWHRFNSRDSFRSFWHWGWNYCCPPVGPFMGLSSAIGQCHLTNHILAPHRAGRCLEVLFHGSAEARAVQVRFNDWSWCYVGVLFWCPIVELPQWGLLTKGIFSASVFCRPAIVV